MITSMTTQTYVYDFSYLHLNLFHQRVVTDKDLKQTELGVSIKPLRLAAILKSAPLLPQSEALGFQMAVDETSSKSSKGKSAKQKKNKSSGKGSGDRLIELGPKKSKCPPTSAAE